MHRNSSTAVVAKHALASLIGATLAAYPGRDPRVEPRNASSCSASQPCRRHSSAGFMLHTHSPTAGTCSEAWQATGSTMGWGYKDANRQSGSSEGRAWQHGGWNVGACKALGSLFCCSTLTWWLGGMRRHFLQRSHSNHACSTAGPAAAAASAAAAPVPSAFAAPAPASAFAAAAAPSAPADRAPAPAAAAAAAAAAPRPLARHSLSSCASMKRFFLRLFACSGSSSPSSPQLPPPAAAAEVPAPLLRVRGRSPAARLIRPRARWAVATDPPCSWL